MKILRKIFAGFSLTAAMFVFQACYGTPQWAEDGVNVVFHVTDEEGTPLENIWIQTEINQSPSFHIRTDKLGQAFLWAPEGSMGHFMFTDQDSAYAVIDTSFMIHDDNDVVDIVLRKQN